MLAALPVVDGGHVNSIVSAAVPGIDQARAGRELRAPPRSPTRQRLAELSSLPPPAGRATLEPVAGPPPWLAPLTRSASQRARRDQLLAPFERGAGPADGLADERVQPGQGSLVLARPGRRQHRHALVGSDGDGLDLDEVVVEEPDQLAGVEVVMGGLLR